MDSTSMYPDPQVAYQMFRTLCIFSVSDDFKKLRLYGPERMALVTQRGPAWLKFGDLSDGIKLSTNVKSLLPDLDV